MFHPQRLQTEAEGAVTAYEYNPNLNLSGIDYINVNEISENLTMEYDPHFGQEVYAEESGVHIPIEIYEGCEYGLGVFCNPSQLRKFH